jgi:hypothetical protein
MRLDHWLTHRGHVARAVRRIHDVDGTPVPRGTVGEVCDVDSADGYVIVDFARTGPILCDPNEVRPA